jgi:hypothetical protein
MPVVKMFPFFFSLASLVLCGCGNKETSENRHAAQQRIARESQEYLEASATRNAPVIAARHNLSVELVRRIILFNGGEQTRAITKLATNPKLEMKELVPDQRALLDQLAAQEHVERRTIGDVLFDNAILNCEDRSRAD